MHSIDGTGDFAVAEFRDGREEADRVGGFCVPVREASALASRLGVACGLDVGVALRGIDGVLRGIWDVAFEWGDRDPPVDYGDLDGALVELSAYGTAAERARRPGLCAIMAMAVAVGNACERSPSISGDRMRGDGQYGET